MTDSSAVPVLYTNSHSTSSLYHSLYTDSCSIPSLYHSLYTDSHSTPSLYHSLYTNSHSTQSLYHSLYTDSHNTLSLYHLLYTDSHITQLLYHSLYTDSHNTPSLYHLLHNWSYHKYIAITPKTEHFTCFITLLNQLSSKWTVSLQRSFSVNLHWHYGNYAQSLQRRCIKICFVLWFWYSYWWGRTCWEMLHSAECEMLRCKCEWLQDFKFSIQLICDIYQGMWTIAGTRLADCIRLLAGTGMNICHEV